MTKLLEVLIEWLSFLYSDGRYRFTDSQVFGSFGGDATLTLASDDLRWRLTRDRDQVFLDCQPAGTGERSWYSTDLLIRLLTGDGVASAVLDEPTAQWVEANLDEIEGRLAPNNQAETLRLLEDLKLRRSREMFG